MASQQVGMSNPNPPRMRAKPKSKEGREKTFGYQLARAVLFVAFVVLCLVFGVWLLKH